MGFDERSRILLGDEAADQLARSSVAVYGLGGVGAACAMDLVRSGIGRIVAFDLDFVKESNLNRLYFGYRRDIGRPKAEVFAEYARDVNPDVVIESERRFFTGENAADIIAANCDVHIDCVDSLNPKANLIAALAARELVFISSMGTAGRLDPSRLRISSVWKSNNCPLATSVRHRLRRMKVEADFPAVWSDEPATAPIPPPEGHVQTSPGRMRNVQGSMAFVPQTAGHLLAAWTVRKILGLL